MVLSRHVFMQSVQCLAVCLCVISVFCETTCAATKAFGDSPKDPSAVGKLGKLPDWVNRLPEIVASLPMQSGPEFPDEEPADEPVVYPDTGRNADDPATSTEKQSAPVVVWEPKDFWHEPETLIENLRDLGRKGTEGRWATDVLKRIRALGPAVVAGSKDAKTIVEQLDARCREAADLAAKMSDKMAAHHLRKMSFALGRRVNVWRHVVDLRLQPTPKAADTPLDAEKLALCLEQIEKLTADSSQGRAWREYLLIDKLKECLARQPKAWDADSRKIGRKVLKRMTEKPLSIEQQRFITSGPLAALRQQLWQWTAEPVCPAVLLADIERYERRGFPSDARRLAIDCQYLYASPVETERALADCIDLYYRNANCRVAVTEELINDLIPEQRLEYAPFNDKVLGLPTVGESLMATQLAVRMLPNPNRVRLALEVKGEIAAETVTDAGVAQIHNDSNAYYIARKPLEIDIQGISLYPVDVYVHNDSEVRGVRTSIDGIPIVSHVVRGIAKIQADQSKSAASAEVKQKLAGKARERIDAETRKQLSGVVDQFNQRVFDPVNALRLGPQMIDAETTKKRFMMRLRLGGEDQLGSHTPRPQALSNSLVSLQLHESLLNNGIERLQMAGRTFALPELSKHVAERLNCPAPFKVNPDNEDVCITFAKQDPIVVRCQEGQVIITVAIAQLAKGPRKWTNFRVRAFYKPQIHGREAELARSGVIHLMGKRLSTGSQIALRGIFSRAFSKQVPWELTPDRFVKEPKLKDTEITQFVVNDGWIGLALGPKPPVPLTAKRP